MTERAPRKAKKEEHHLAMQYGKYGKRYYQKTWGRRHSGDPEWHSRTPKYRRLQRAISDSVGVVSEGRYGDLAVRIAEVLND
jgi:hypothetical protein